MFVFDLDDTLYKERDFVDSALRHVAARAAETGIITAADALRILREAESKARGFDNLSAVMWDADPRRALSAAEMVEIWRTHKPDIALPEETREVLGALQHRGVRLGLITDGRSNTQRAKIAALGLEKYFTPADIIISGETGQDKENQLPFRLMEERNPGETEFIYVGDNPAKDFRWPNRMGWETVQLDDINRENTHSQLIDVPAEYRAKRHITSLRQLL